MDVDLPQEEEYAIGGLSPLFLLSWLVFLSKYGIL